MYDPVLSLKKAGKALAVVLGSAVVAGLLDPGVAAILNGLGDSLVVGIPVVGGALAPAVKSALLAGVVAAVEGLRNAIKHLEG